MHSSSTLLVLALASTSVNAFAFSPTAFAGAIQVGISSLISTGNPLGNFPKFTIGTIAIPDVKQSTLVGSNSTIVNATIPTIPGGIIAAVFNAAPSSEQKTALSVNTNSSNVDISRLAAEGKDFIASLNATLTNNTLTNNTFANNTLANNTIPILTAGIPPIPATLVASIAASTGLDAAPLLTTFSSATAKAIADAKARFTALQAKAKAGFVKVTKPATVPVVAAVVVATA